MESKIGKVENYDMFYDCVTKQFVLRNTSGEELASAKTQEELEKQADRLAKQAFAFPIQAIQCSQRSVTEGRVTSLNISEKSVWFVENAEKGSYAYRGKKHLRYSPDLFEVTGHNTEIASQIREHLASIKALEDSISELGKQFEKPIDLKYFGLQ